MSNSRTFFSNRRVVLGRFQKQRNSRFGIGPNSVPGIAPVGVRGDRCNALIAWLHHGELIGTGWEIDHIDAVANDGGDETSNLQPLQWQNNRAKGDSPPINGLVS